MNTCLIEHSVKKFVRQLKNTIKYLLVEDLQKRNKIYHSSDAGNGITPFCNG